MLKRFLIIIITTLALTSNALAGTDGELILKKNKPSEIKDCSEKFNRATFAFNQVLDGFNFITPLRKNFLDAIVSSDVF